MKALGARALPIPNSIDIFFLKEEIEPSDTVTALEAVMSVDEERLKLEARAEELNNLMAEVRIILISLVLRKMGKRLNLQRSYKRRLWMH